MAKSFRVYPGVRPYYYKVVVYPTQSHMFRGAKRYAGSRRCECNFAAVVLPRQTGDSKIFLGHILFSRDKLRFEYLVHEAVHAAIRYAIATKKSVKSEYNFEERLCYATSTIVDQLIDHVLNPQDE